jgi:hypothetical protein
MPRTLSTLAPSLVFATLTFALANSARADVAPRRPQASPEQPETKTEPPAPTDTKTDAKTDVKTETKTDAKAETKTDTSSCSIETNGDRTVLGLAALVLLISGTALRRRSA